ncbi:MAG: replication protein P [Plesiomonas shigelloides]
MNTLTRAIEQRDASVLSRMMPAANCDLVSRVVNPQAERLVDMLFSNLKLIFPAAVSTIFKNPADEAAAKRQWILAFAENGITTREQVAAGMRVARTAETDFWPSVGKFIGWCNSGSASHQGLPDVDEVMDEFDRYCARHHDYERPEDFPWSSPVMYWIVLDMRRSMYQYNQTASELRISATTQLRKWEKKLLAGEVIPTPVAQVENKVRPASVVQQLDADGRYRALGESMLAAIRARKGVSKGGLQ